MSKPKLPPCSTCQIQEDKAHKKGSKISRLYFWLFIILAIMSAFMLWSARGDAFINKNGGGVNTSYLAAIIAVCLAVMFGLFVFVRFIRTRSVAGGLFMTTAISTGIFLAGSQAATAIIPPTAAAFTNNPEAVNSGYQAIVSLAQIGLFALWFLFLLLTIYVQVSPVKKIDKVLAKICDGEEVRKVRIGKSRQYRIISEKLEVLSRTNNERIKKEQREREQATARRLASKLRSEERRAKQAKIEEKFEVTNAEEAAG